MNRESEERLEELNQALDEIGAALKAQGLSLEDMIERGRAIREELYEERYGAGRKCGNQTSETANESDCPI